MTELEQELLASYHDAVQSFRYSIQHRQQRIIRNYAILFKLKELGFYTGDMSWYCLHCPSDIQVQTKDLPLLKKEFEDFKVEDSYTIHSAEHATIRVYINLGGPRSFVYYVKPLPENSKCKIVTTSFINHDLICER